MSIVEHIISAGRCLSASKMRTFLTTLGIIVGISSVILINTIGSTIGKTIESTMSSLIQGNHLTVAVFPDDFLTTGDMTSETFFTEEMYEAFEEACDGRAKREIANYKGDVQIVGTEKESAYVNIFAVSPNSLSSLGADMVEGRYISDEDIENCSAVAVISDKAAEKIFEKGTNALGKQVSVKNVQLTLTVVGIYKSKMDAASLVGGDDQYPTNFIMPYSFYNNRYGDDSQENMVSFIIPNDADQKEFDKIAKDVLTPYINDNEFIYTESIAQDLDMVNSVVGVITKIIAAIAAVSLLVGGIGVMNIMLVSVTERTMEIGVRKAMGADNKSIRAQFITESVMISLLGSVIGIVLGLVEAKLLAIIAVKVTSTMSLPISIDLGVPVAAIVLSVVFSFLVGLVFGVYPADKAAKMEVVDALRYE